MSQTLHRFTVNRTPRTAQARNTLGYGPTPFRVIAATEGEAIRKAKGMGAYDATHFTWKVESVDELTPAEMGDET